MWVRDPLMATCQSKILNAPFYLTGAIAVSGTAGKRSSSASIKGAGHRNDMFSRCSILSNLCSTVIAVFRTYHARPGFETRPFLEIGSSKVEAHGGPLGVWGRDSLLAGCQF